MGLKERLKQKRLEKDMTLEEVANKIGVSRQTIQRYESGIISNIPSDKIEVLAVALDTTPAYLMGWESETSIYTESNAALLAKVAKDPSARKLLSYYFGLSEKGKIKALDNIEDLAKIYHKETD